MWRWGKLTLVALIAGQTLVASPCWSNDDSADAAALERRLVELQKSGKGSEALALARRALADAEHHFGPEHQAVGTRLFLLALLYQAQGNNSAAEPLFTRALTVTENALGPQHQAVGTILNRFADFRWAQKRHMEALSLYERVVKIREGGSNSEHMAAALDKLAGAYRVQGRSAEARPLLERALAIREKALGPDHSDVAVSLKRLAQIYISLKQDGEAEPLLKRYVLAREKILGPDHPDLGAALDELAAFYHARERHSDALPLRQRALRLRERSWGPDDRGTAASMFNLAATYNQLSQFTEAEGLLRRALKVAEKTESGQDKFLDDCLILLAVVLASQNHDADAEPLWKRALAIREKAFGPDHIEVALALKGLAETYVGLGRFAEAKPLLERALANREKARGRDHPEVADCVDGIAELYVEQGRLAEAEHLAKRALAIREKAVGPHDLSVALSLHNLATLYDKQGRYAEAEPLFKRALAIREKVLGHEHGHVGRTFHNLASLYENQGRVSEAEQLYKRALAVKEKALGADNLEVGFTLNNLASLYQDQGRLAEAEQFYLRTLDIFVRFLGFDHAHVGTALSNLAIVYAGQGRKADAEALYKRALAVKEKALGPDHLSLASTIQSLAAHYIDQDRYLEAGTLFMRALSIHKTALGPDHPDVARTLAELGGLHFGQGDWKGAASYWRQSADVVMRRARRRAESVGQATTGKASSEVERSGSAFVGLVKVLHRLAGERGSPDLANEAFLNAQWALGTEAAASLAQMASRQAHGKGALANLVRERQDLVGEWQALDNVLIAARSEEAHKRDFAAEQAKTEHLASIDARIGDIDKMLARDFPEYAALSSPTPLTIAQAQAELGDNEALVLFFVGPEVKPTPEETFIWAITRTQSRYVRVELGAKALIEHVLALRCGLDFQGQWLGKGAKRCSALLKPKAAPAGPSALPFDLDRAHDLYMTLFGKIEDMTKDKHLLVVPAHALTWLPFQVLVTQKPTIAVPAAPSGYAQVAWLAKRQAITVLPSVASLKALRQSRSSQAMMPFIGFGNPLLTGHDGTDRRAWDRQSCREEKPGDRRQFEVAATTIERSVASFFDRGLGSVETVRRQPPLPETTDELCAVARTLGANETTVHLGEKATERDLKSLSADGTLGNSRVVHFATHGLLAGETASLATSKAEPALLLTPPDHASEEDDGLLTASEVTQLKLDADWVIMSACNTAAGEAPGAEAFSGLARAFFYAGARALLVSHWYVNSDAAVSLTTGAFNALKRDPMIGRSEALRRAMLSVIAKGGNNAHPANWAPFVVVGEGGALAPGSTSAATAGTVAASPVAARSGPPGTGSVQSVDVAPAQPKSKRRASRRRKPAGDWDWLGDLW